jgi:ATP-binding cassette subfamily B protein
MNRISEDFKVRNVICHNVTPSMIIRFTIVIVYMYNVSPSTLYTILPLPLLSYGIFQIEFRNQ